MKLTTFLATALVAATGIIAQDSTTTSMTTTTTMTRTVEQVIATTTAVSSSIAAPVAYNSSSESSVSSVTSLTSVYPSPSPLVTLSTVPYGYGNGTSVLSSGTGVSTGGIPSQTYPSGPVSTNAAGYIGIDAMALAAVAGIVGFALV